MKQSAYQLISGYYGKRKTKRSEVPLMHHIDEGLIIMEILGVQSQDARDAYCLHPIFQSDEDLAANQDMSRLTYPNLMTLVMEYRSVANEYLSHRVIKSITEIRLSPLQEVTDMLKADKLQNYKDFKQYHLGRHERSDELWDYFMNWFDALGIEDFPGIVDELRERTGE